MPAEPQVREFEPPGRFHVEGQSTSLYLVDLCCWWGASMCSCLDWENRHGPKLKLGKQAAMDAVGATEWPTPRLQCKHTAAVLRYIDRRDGPGEGNKLAVKLSQEKKGPNEP